MNGQPTPSARGAQAEAQALAHLEAAGLRLIARNYRIARGPRAWGGELDLVMRDRDGTLVFVEVRARAKDRHGGAGASLGPTKLARLRRAAAHFLARWPGPTPPCRFDVVLLEGTALRWLPAAFDAG